MGQTFIVKVCPIWFYVIRYKCIIIGYQRFELLTEIIRIESMV